MDFRLEVVLPVSDVDRAKEFYVGLGRACPTTT
jgi:catechol 2,3-dioxygenase-like lactoylglutathione lyase family enzyme